MTDVEIQRMRANVYRDEVLDSHAVIERLEKELRELKAEHERIKNMLYIALGY